MWLDYDEARLPVFEPKVNKEIKTLYEMELETDTVYTNPDGQKRIVLMFGYPKGAITPDTEYQTIETRRDTEGNITKEVKQYNTPNANGYRECYISYRTIDWDKKDVYFTLRKINLNTSDSKVRKLLKQCKIEDITTTVTEFASWLKWKKGAVEGEKMPDTTPTELPANAKAELAKIKAALAD